MKRVLVLFLMLTFLVSALFSVTASGASTVSRAKPTPIKLITITGDITKINPGMPYNKALPAIVTKDAKYILTGNIPNIEKYIGYSSIMSGSVQTGPQGIQFFSVVTCKILKKTTPTPTKIVKSTPTSVSKPVATSTNDIKTSTTPVIQISTPVAPVSAVPTVTAPVSSTLLVGYLGVIDPVKQRFVLKTEKGIAYELIGNIKGLENEVGKQLEVYGGYVYTLVATEFPLFSVEWYKEVAQPTATPVPAVTTITEKDNGGYVYVKLGTEVKLELSSNPSTGYSWQYDIKPDPNILLETNYEILPNPMSSSLNVGAGGIEVWTFKTVSAGTTAMYLSYGRPWESTDPAQSFKVKVIVDPVSTATPAITPIPYIDLTGILSVSVAEIDPTAKIASPYKFSLKTEKGPFMLLGNVAGLEAYDGQTILVTGTISPLDIYPPIFDVVGYKYLPTPTIAPTSTPIPSSTNKTHTIISNKALYISDPSIGSMFEAGGSATISWIENTTKAFFDVKANILQMNSIRDYEIELVQAVSTDNSSITGIFNIKINGKIVDGNVKGKVYLLDQPVGSYFKFYSDGEKWHFSGYITNRIDF